MSDRRCETCRHFFAWANSFAFAAEGLCAAPFPELPMPQPDRQRRKYDGQKCQVWEKRDE